MARVLVIDDETQYRETLSDCLAEEGYEVQTAGTGEEAIRIAGAFRPNVLIADWMLRNHMTGLDVVRRLQQAFPGMESILITGFPSSELMANAKQADVFEIFEKPFDLDDFLSVVHYASRSAQDRGSGPASS